LETSKRRTRRIEEETFLMILAQLRGRDVDTVHIEPISGDPWWLKPFIINGKRTGITDCCQYGYECSHHKEVRNKLESQQGEMN